MDRKIVAIVPAAGIGRRFDSSKRKTFTGLDGVPLFVHTLQRLHREEAVTHILPVLRKQDIKEGLGLTSDHNLSKIKQIAPGGRERQDSIYNALKLLDPERAVGRDSIILIHDGARPFIPEGTIETLIEELNGFDGAAPGIPARETLKEVSSEGTVVSTVNRDKIWAIQTPQVFSFTVIMDAYARAYADGFYATDDAALVERVGGRIRIIPGSPYNIKITTREDLKILEYLLMKKDL